LAAKGILIVGAGGHAKVLIATAQALDLPIIGLLDDNEERYGELLLGVPIIGRIDVLGSPEQPPALIAVGDNATRRRIALGFPHQRWHTLVHPRAWVHPSVSLGPGTVVLAGAMIQPSAHLGAHVIVNTGATVDHDCRISDFVHVAPGVNLSGGVCLGEGAFLGVGACALPLAEVGAWSIVGGGGAVVNSLPDHVTAVGQPARIIKVRQPDGFPGLKRGTP